VRAWTVSATTADTADDEINANDETNEWHFAILEFDEQKKKIQTENKNIEKIIYNWVTSLVYVYTVQTLQYNGRVRYLLHMFMYIIRAYEIRAFTHRHNTNKIV